MNRSLSQEKLKLIACVTMLVDHVGVVLVPHLWLRMIGRLSFPIFCFLLAEGVFHTRHPGKYALRLAGVALLTEIPFDLCFFGGIYWLHQNVLFTMLLGFCALQAGKKLDSFLLKLLVTLPFMFLAERLQTDYGMEGVLLIAIFGLTREFPRRELCQALLMLLLFYNPGGWGTISVLGIPVNAQALCVLAMIPIALYSGEKHSYSKWLQWGFYLFYPAHLTLLTLLS